VAVGLAQRRLVEAEMGRAEVAAMAATKLMPEKHRRLKLTDRL
jgi:hypothetical protein